MNQKETDKEIEMNRNSPIFAFGKYKGVKVSQVPMSYLRWILGQTKFPAEFKEYAKYKIDKNKTTNADIDVTRHAYDSFSLRYLRLWQNSNIGMLGKQVGMGSFLAEMSQRAWEEGKDVSKDRHQDEELIKLYQGVKFVFNKDPSYRVLITVM